MLSQIQEYFEERGITAADFPKALLTHEILSVTFLAATWVACYNIQPSQSPMFAPVNKAFQESSNRFVVGMRNKYHAMVVGAERRMGQSWLANQGIDTGRLAVSLAESSLFRKLAKPITIPAKLWLTILAVQAMPKTEVATEAAAEVDKGGQAGARARREKGNERKVKSGRGSRRGRARHKAACSPSGAGCFVAASPAF
ncbi:unnamed protein product [Choristocarpus tenellus]